MHPVLWGILNSKDNGQFKLFLKVASEGAATVIGFKLFHNVIVCGTNE